MSEEQKQAWAEDASWSSSRRRGKGKLAEGSKAVDADRQAAIEKAVESAVEEARPGLDKIPDPVEPAGEGALTSEEVERLRQCEAGIALAETVWFMQGKSLDTIATGRLFRTTPHKLDPERCYTTIEDWAWTEKGVRPSKCSQLRAAWPIGEVLMARGYETNPGQVRELVPVKNAFSLNAAVAVYVLVAESVGAEKVTADRLRETIKLMPGDLRLEDDEDPDVLAKTIKGVLLGELPAAAPAIPPAVTRAVDRRAIDLANGLERSRIPRSEVQLQLMQAFSDPEDSTVFDIVLNRMRAAEKAARTPGRKPNKK
ncbi:hypothetical protein [Streptomyces sp. NPDC047315]|uniref:hypothetical protein n=1 Tax=Streptomyces sp. NPDC047315 TaxID=3155142 RepID=UPI003401BAD0